MSFGKNKGSSRSQDSVWRTQAPYLASLYGQAERTAYGQLPTIGRDASALSGGLMGGAGGWLTPGTNPAIANLMQRAQTSNPFLDQQIAGLGADMGQFFKQQVLPGIASSAGLHGQFGGSRQGIAAGMAGQDMARQFAQGATALRSGAYGQGMQAALGAGGLGQAGVAGLGDVFNLGLAPYSAQLAPLQALAGILGPPTVLGSSRGRESGFRIGIT